MKIKEGFILRQIADSYVVVPVGQATIDFNGMMNLNETGAFLFQKMIEGTTKEQLLSDMLAEYDVDKDKAQKDIDAFVEKVRKENLFE